MLSQLTDGISHRATNVLPNTENLSDLLESDYRIELCNHVITIEVVYKQSNGINLFLLVSILNFVFFKWYYMFTGHLL